MSLWYVDNAASGANDGTSWTDAWESFEDIVWDTGGVVAGDTLYISGGTVSKTYNTRLPVGASGSEGNVITVCPGGQAGHNGTVIIDLEEDEEQYSALSVSGKSYVKVSGNVGGECHIVCTNSCYDGVEIASSSHDIEVEYIETDNNSLLPNGHGISVVINGATAEIDVHHCKVHNTHGDEMLIAWAGHTQSGFGKIRIHHNDIYDSHYDWVKILAPDTDFYNNTIRSRGVYEGDHPDGIQFWNGYTRIFNNHFYDFIMADGDADFNSYIRFNPDENGGEAQPEYVWIYNNLFTETRTPDDNEQLGRGIELSFSDPYCTGADHIYFMNNVVTGCPFFGLFMGFHGGIGTADVSDLRIMNNVFVDANRSAWGSDMLVFDKGDGSITYGSDGDGADVTIDYNSVYASSATYTTDVAFPTEMSYADFKTASGCQDHDVTADPDLDENYRPNVGSPLRAAGDDLSAYFTTDKNGTTRTAWDIGAYEYSGGAPPGAPFSHDNVMILK